MPIIEIEFDDTKVSDDAAKNLSQAAQRIVSEVTGIEDVFVYGNSARIKLQVAPIEIFVKMSAPKIQNLDSLTGDIRSRLVEWKAEDGFEFPINLTVIPMVWKVEIEI